jgi:zinc/manganese transport system substrate-binding protein
MIMNCLRSEVVVICTVWLSCSAGQVLAAAKLKVVTTTTDLKSIVESIGGDKVEVSCLGTGREDPHFIDAKPSYMLIAREADLWVRVGLELEIGYEGLILDGARNPKIRIGAPNHLDASEGVLRLELPTGKIDRSMGDIHPQGNPHYWLDPLNMRIVAKNVNARLSKLDPSDAPYFAERLKGFQKQLDEAMFGPRLLGLADGARLWAMVLKGQFEGFAKEHGGDKVTGGWWGTMRPLSGTKIITYHRSWTYFANRFGLDVIDQLEPKPGIEPSPGHLSEVITKVQREGAKFLLMEPFYSRKPSDFIAEKTGIKVVQVAASVGGQPEATDYIHMIDNIVRSCAAAVAGSSPTSRQE